MTHFFTEQSRLPDGAEIERYTMRNDAGMTVEVLSYGCVIQRIIVPDRSGAPTDVALGYDDAGSYEKGGCCYGACVGRYANRIKGAAFTLNGIRYQLEKNSGDNHLHGIFGSRIFNSRIEGDSLVLSRYCPSQEEGFPGDLTLEVRYRLTEDNALVIDYAAVSDEDTIINLTNHTYFNLNGQDGSDILSHTLRLSADSFTEVDAHQLSTGRILSVGGTPLDFRTEKEIGADIFSDEPQLLYGGGYDNNMILSDAEGELREFAVVKSRKTGIVLSASTTEPAVQLYTGNLIHTDPVPHGKSGIRYPRYGGFCLEAQHYPCAPNYPDFPSTVLKKGDTYRQTTVYRFSVTES